MTEKENRATIPVCTTGFKDLEQILLKQLSSCADCQDGRGKPSLNGEPRIGQLEMMSAMILLVDQMIEFGFFVGGRGQEKQNGAGADGVGKDQPDFSQINLLYSALFQVLDTRQEGSGKTSMGAEERQNSGALLAKIRAVRAADRSVEARFRNDLRRDALNLLLRLFNMRLNFRISIVIDAWEKIFEDIESSSRGLLALQTDSTQTTNVSANQISMASAKDSALELENRIQSLVDKFSGFDDNIVALGKGAFERSIVCPVGVIVVLVCASNLHVRAPNLGL